jgi:hypothetical protein
LRKVQGWGVITRVDERPCRAVPEHQSSQHRYLAPTPTCKRTRCGHAGALVVGLLKDAYGDDLSAPAISAALVAVAKGLGTDALGQGADALVKGLEATVPAGALTELKVRLV